MTTIMLFLLGLIVGVVWTTGLVLLVLLVYFKREAKVTQFIESQLKPSEERAQFYEPVSAEEQIDNLFNIKK